MVVEGKVREKNLLKFAAYNELLPFSQKQNIG